jgi:hypothetical protein
MFILNNLDRYRLIKDEISQMGGGKQMGQSSKPAQAKKLSKPPSQPLSQAWWHAPVNPTTWESW